MLKKSIFILGVFLISLSFISAVTQNPFNYESDKVFNYPEETLDGHKASFFMPLNKSISGNFSFNGDCLDGGIEFREDGTICGQRLEVFNITSVNVTKQTVTVTEDFIIDGDLYMNNNDILNAKEITATEFINVTSDVAGGANSQINIINTNTLGFSGLRLANNDNDQAFYGLFSRNLSNFLFPDFVDIGESISGFSSFGGPIFMATTENHSIYFGSSPNLSIPDSDWFLQIEPIEQALVIQGNKKIRPIKVDGGFSMVFESEEVLDEGGFPFTFIARDSLNETIITSWQQNGANNSFSGGMNSNGQVPKDWILYNNEQMSISDLEFMFNVSNYPKYCNWLQTNLSLIAEGCKYFADTSGRGVPLLFGGDLEIHRSATIHEGLLLYNSFNFIDRNSNDFNLLWTETNTPAKLHIRSLKTIEGNFSSFDFIITDFDDGTISPFVSESIDPEIGRDWASVLSISCHQNLCARAIGGNEKIMSFSASTQFQNGTIASTNSRILFYLTTDMNVGDVFNVTLDDNEGNLTAIYTLTSTSVTDILVNVSFPAEFENKSNVTTTVSFNGLNINRQAFIDVVRVTSIPEVPIIINESYQGGKITLGEDTDNTTEVYIESDKEVNEITQSTETRLTLSSEIIKLNPLAGSYINGEAYVCVTDDGVIFAKEIACS